MKKFLFLLITAFAVAACDDDCDHGYDGGGMASNLLLGSWYEETQNEEDTYSASSAFYGKYCNKLVQGEGQGTYRLDTERNRLTWSYHVNGMGMTSDWKLRDVSKYQFVQYSDVAILTYGKIVDTYNMNGGDTKTISFNELNVQGYESTNEYIATVSSDGLVTATGEKGTAYIKVKCLEANVYVKVIVGDNYPDLWIDYSGLLGNDYAAMKNMLGDPDSSSENSGYSLYVYVTELHNILRGLRVSINSDTHKIDQIDMIIREGVPQEELLAYMNAHYYRLAGNYGTQYHYSTSSGLEESRATYAYDTKENAVMIISCEDYMEQMGLLLFPNFSFAFGLGKEELKENMQYKGYSFYQSFDTYSQNGSDAYLINGYEKVYAAEFIFNPDDVISEYWLYLNATDQNIDALAEILKYLKDHYTEATDEYVEGYGMIFYNKDKTIRVTYDLSKYAIVFTDLTMKAVSRVILGKYWKGLGMTTNELVSMFGDPYLVRNNDQGNLQYFYSVVNDYLASVTFNFNKKKEVNLINVFLRDEVNSEIVKDYLNTLYTFQEEVSTEQGPVMRWIDAQKEEDASMKIGFYTDYGVVVYKPFVEEPDPVQEEVIPDYSLLINITASQVKDAMGYPEREMSRYYVYSPTGHEYVKRVMIGFEDTPITDSTLSTTISVTLNENHNQDKLLEYLNSVYDEAPDLSSDSSYGFRTKDRKVILQYLPSTNSITFMKSYGF